MISAWFRNVQVHPLGSAYGVYARFLVEMSGQSMGLFEITTSIPYLQHGTNVQIDLLGCLSSDDVVVSLGELSFFDLYDRRHSHVSGEQGTSAQLGRLRAILRDGALVAVAEGRPRGPNIRYDE